MIRPSLKENLFRLFGLERPGEKLVLDREAQPPALIIFSKDRACQVDGLLQSVAGRATISPNPIVIWKTSAKSHAEGYARIQELHPGVNWIEEKSFRQDLSSLLQESPIQSLMFCTDDGIFFASPPSLPVVDWGRVAGISLRLGQNSRYCHPADEDYPPPKFQAAGNLLAWRWKKARGDFRVVYSLDAHIYPRKRILEVLQRFDFSNPNQLEDRLNRFGSEDAPEWMLCPEQSCYVSLPINRVNTEFANRSGLQYPVSEEELLARLMSGQRLDIKNIVSSVPKGPHQEYPLRWIQ